MQSFLSIAGFFFENDLGAKDQLMKENGEWTVDDTYCIDYMKEHLLPVADAIEEDVRT